MIAKINLYKVFPIFILLSVRPEHSVYDLFLAMAACHGILFFVVYFEDPMESFLKTSRDIEKISLFIVWYDAVPFCIVPHDRIAGQSFIVVKLCFHP